MSKEESLTEDDVRDEHMKAVNVPAHWAYLFGVLLGGLVLMLLLIAVISG